MSALERSFPDKKKPKNKVLDMKKLQKTKKKYKNVLQHKFSEGFSMILFFYEDVVINQATLMFSKKYWFLAGLYLI